jgi:hypothetical protein
MKHAYGRLALCLVTLSFPLASLADEPDVKVARVSYTDGDVSYQRGDSEGWNALGVNTPLVTGDSLYTADGGRAELNLGSGNALRLDAGTQVDLIQNARDVAQLGLRSGYVSLHARSASDSATLEIDTPSGAATVQEPGTYRVEITDRGARYSAVKGRLSVALSGQQLDVDSGESLTIEGTDKPKYSFDAVAPQTPFDQWAHDRDIRAERSESARYVHPDVVGSEDLDDHGYWRDTRQYGRVWTPSGVPPDWAPYRAGSWMWQDPYGWTWVSDESWGWAPYHYGRWMYVGGAWGWVPPPPVGYRGPAVVAEIHPSYAPALVAFVGGANWSVGVSLGGGPSVGWVPLAPAEPYTYPWQPAPRVTNHYTNITVINAVTVVNTTTFGSGRVRPISVPPRQLIHAPVIGSAPTGIVPTHESLCPSQPRDPHSRYVPHRRDESDRPLIVRTPPPPAPVPFHEKVAEIQRTGRPFEGHDRGEHNGWKNHDDRDRRFVAVSATPPERHETLTPAPGAPAKPPLRVGDEVGARPHPQGNGPRNDSRIAERTQPGDPWSNRPAPPPPPQSEPEHGRGNGDDHANRHQKESQPEPSGPQAPQTPPAPVSAPPSHPERGHGHAMERPAPVNAPTPVGAPTPVSGPTPVIATPPAPPSEPERAHGRAAEPVHNPHVAPAPASAPAPVRAPAPVSIPAPHAEAAPPAAHESHGQQQHESPKGAAPKPKDDKGKGKDKHADEGKPEGH